MARGRTESYPELGSKKSKKPTRHSHSGRFKESPAVLYSTLNEIPAAGSGVGIPKSKGFLSYLSCVCVTAELLVGIHSFSLNMLHDYSHGSLPSFSSLSLLSPSIESSVLRAQVEAARKIVLAPMSPAEKEAQPFVTRILNNQDLAQTITDIAATNGTSIVDMLQVIAAETGGDPNNFKPNIIGARTAMQITPDQFVRLLGTYGETYATRMRAYATQTDDRAESINAQADELAFVAQFIQLVPSTMRFVENNAAYQRLMQKEAHGETYATLQQRIDGLYANGYVSMGMQNLSNTRDTAILTEKLRAQKIAPPAAPERVLNYLGLPGAYDLFRALHRTPNMPIIGNLMDQKAAINNRVAYHMKAVTKLVDGQQKAVEVPETHEVKVWVPASVHGRKRKKAHFEKIDLPVPWTVAQMYEVQIEPGERAHSGFAESYNRFNAARLL